MFYENNFIVSVYTLKLRGIDQSYLKNYLRSKNFYVTDLPVSAIICRLDFLCFVGIHLSTFSTLAGQFSFSKTKGLTNKATGSIIVL